MDQVTCSLSLCNKPVLRLTLHENFVFLNTNRKSIDVVNSNCSFIQLVFNAFSQLTNVIRKMPKCKIASLFGKRLYFANIALA